MNSGLWILEGINKCRGGVQQAATEEEDEKGRNVDDYDGKHIFEIHIFLFTFYSLACY